MPVGVDFAQLERDYVRSRIYSEFSWRPYDSFSPVNPLRVAIPKARVAFVTTAGVHLRDDERFDTDAKAGDPSFRSFGSNCTFEQLRLSHGGYDTRRASNDLNVVLPLDHLRATVARGLIGQLTSTIYSFMGYIAATDKLVHETSTTTMLTPLRGWAPRPPACRARAAR